jgi:hypothetical protein
MRPVVYYNNLLLSGTLTGSNSTSANPVRLVDDGSINVAYALTSATTLQSGHVRVALTSAQAPAALSLPKCEIPSGYTLKLQSMTDPVTEAGLVTVVSATFTTMTRFFLVPITGAAVSLHWRVMLSGVSGLVPAQTHEVQLAQVAAIIGSVQLGVDRGHVLQKTRIPVPGGQPFVRRDGPKLDRTGYVLIAASGAYAAAVSGLADQAVLQAFIEAVEGGDAFTLTDDLNRSYWAELLDGEVMERDDAGVSAWRLTFQEIQVDG